PTDPAGGPLFETFVANEIAKQLTWCETPARLFHFRDSDGAEVGCRVRNCIGRCSIRSCICWPTGVSTPIRVR
ncbi:MAG: DUF4143 domain-containing protein, partial [Pseudonocardiales bacterium]